MTSGVEENIYGFRWSILRSKESVGSSSRTLVDEASDDDQYNNVITLQEFGDLVEE